MFYSREFKIALYSLDGVGVKHYLKILTYLTKHEISEADFWVNRAGFWKKIPLNKNIEKSIIKFNKEHNIYSYVELLSAKNIRVVLAEDQEYPSLLRELDFHPPLLFVKGANLNLQETLGVVGSRKMTPYGKQVIKSLIPDLVPNKVIISGFMYGVDVTAQQVALDSGGQTVGVLGFGFDFMYPSNHRQIFRDFLAKGACFISPFAPHVSPKPGNFPARNVVVAGISKSLCVIEAAKNSGSLLTAAVSAELGREVWAVPGSIFSPFSEGVQELLKQGAALVRTAEDINPDLKRSKKSLINRVVSNLDKNESLILSILQNRRHSFDELLDATGFAGQELQTILFNLQLKDLVEEHGVWWFSRI